MKKLILTLIVTVTFFTFNSNAFAEDITADIFENGKNVGTVTMKASKFPAYATGLKKKGMKAVAQKPKGGMNSKDMKDKIAKKREDAKAKHEDMKQSLAERKAANLALHEKWKQEANN